MTHWLAVNTRGRDTCGTSTLPATGPGKCPCCMTPYLAGSILTLDHGKWVLVDHVPPWKAPPPPRPRRDVLDRNAIPRKQNP